MASLPPSIAANIGDSASTGTPLTIGSVTFNNIEHPDELPFVFHQVNAIHELIGGGRIIQTFGTQPKELKWEGNFFDSSANSRIRSLMSMLAAGTPVSLDYQQYSFEVIITDFTATVYHQYWAKYSIAVEIFQDNSALYTQLQGPNIDLQTITAYNQVLTNSADLTLIDPNYDGSTLDLPNLQDNLNAATPIATASSADLSSAITSVSTAQDALTTYQTSLTTGLNYSSATSDQLSAVAISTKMQNSLNVIGQNLSHGQAPLTIQTSNASTFALASQYYGDVSQYSVIKNANGLNSPFTGPNVTNLVIPSVSSS